MTDKEIREKAVLIAFDNTGYADKIVEHLSDANLLMTADALEAMELCARARDVRFGTPDYDNFLADAKSVGRRILARREQEKGPRYVVEANGLATSPSHRVAAVSTPDVRFVGTESECRCVADALNKHAGEK